MEDEDEDSLDGGLGAVKPSSAVVAAASALRNEILRRGAEDTLLGSEEELTQRLGVSQPTFRQAARLLEYEELLTVRRGMGGGYFMRRPSAKVVARMAATYLAARRTDFSDVMQTQHALESEVIRRLAEIPQQETRRRLSEHIGATPALQDPINIPSTFRAINRFWRLAGQLSGSESLALFTLASQAYAIQFASINLSRSQISAYLYNLSKMADAISAGSSAKAIAIRQKSNTLMLSWISEDGGQGAT